MLVRMGRCDRVEWNSRQEPIGAMKRSRVPIPASAFGAQHGFLPGERKHTSLVIVSLIQSQFRDLERTCDQPRA